jgi:hypothetical protein
MKNPYGLKGGQLVTVDSVERGLACGCICPKCNGRLEARQGDEKVYYFAHDDGLACEAGYQTALQTLAKEVLEEDRRLRLPSLPIYPTVDHPLRRKVFREVVKDGFLVEPDEVTLEYKLGRSIPDLVVRVNNRLLLLEMWVTQCVDDKTREKIWHLNVGAIEYNFSKTNRVVTKEDLRLEIRAGNGQWLFNARQQSAQEKLDRDLVADSAAVLRETQELNRRKRIRQADRGEEGQG